MQQSLISSSHDHAVADSGGPMSVLYRPTFPTRPEVFHSLWIGGPLSTVEHACLASFVRHGHELTLWCYDVPQELPAGLLVRNAAEILPADQIVRHKSGSVSLFSNRFRYELQRRSLGVWVDTDVYLLKPVPQLPEHTFAWEDSRIIGTAVLRLPANSPLIDPLLSVFEEREVPRWLPLRERVAAYARRIKTGRTGLAQMPWGSAGPRAVTYLCGRHGLTCHALPSEIFYPVHWSRAEWILDPSLRVEDMITDRTVGIHLWNELIKNRKLAHAPKGSFLARLQAEGAGALDEPIDGRIKVRA